MVLSIYQDPSELLYFVSYHTGTTSIPWTMDMPTHRPLSMALFTYARSCGTRPDADEQSCMVPYYQQALDAFLKQAKREGVRLWRHTCLHRGGALSALNETLPATHSYAGAKAAPHVVDVLLLWYDISNTGPLYLQQVLQQSRRLYPSTPVIVYLAKLWKNGAEKLAILKKERRRVLLAFAPTPHAAGYAARTMVPFLFLPMGIELPQTVVSNNNPPAVYTCDMAFTGAMTGPLASECRESNISSINASRMGDDPLRHDEQANASWQFSQGPSCDAYCPMFRRRM